MGLVFATGCASAPSAPTGAAADVPSVSETAPSATPSASASSAIPWIDLPGNHYEPAPVPTPALTTQAPACTAGQLTPTDIRGPGVTGDHGQIVDLRNDSSTACLLTGAVQATLRGAGVASLRITSPETSLKVQSSYDMQPGQSTSLEFFTGGGDDPSPNTPGFSTADIAIPGGGAVMVHGLGLYDLCVAVGPFYRYHPDPVYPTAPLARATATIEAPRTARAGGTLDYVVAIHNPTSAAVTMEPCPSYQESLATFSDKTYHQLNCAGHTSLAAGQTLRFEMRLAVPALEPNGPETLRWWLDSLPNAKPSTITIVGSSASPVSAPPPSLS